MAAPRCECTEVTSGLGCRITASWLVGVGSRKSDAQLSCGRHLNITCQLMASLEGRAGVTLTVTPVTARQAQEHADWRGPL